MTLALLLTAVTGAWADIAVGDVFKTGSTIDFGTISVRYKTYSGSSDNSTLGATGKQTLTYQQYTNGKHWFNISTGSGVQSIYIVSDNTAEPWGIKVSGGEGTMGNPYSFEVLFTEPPFYLTRVSQPGATPQQWEFEMPGSDVVLTPMYASATIYQNDGETEKQAYETLKEAFANVQDGDVIKLDWDVFIDGSNPEVMNTMQRATADPVKFTLDFNGHIIDGLGVDGAVISTSHVGDEITFIDSSDGQTGGFKGRAYGVPNSFIFAGGRYNYNDMNAAAIQQAWSQLTEIGWQLADGMEFVDLKGGADANDGFMVRVAHKAYELTIGAGKFATFYMDQNITLADGTDANIGLYTISSIDADRSTATVTPISGIIPAGTPMLVYNGTEQEQTAKLIVTLDNAQDAIAWDPQFKGTATDHEFTADDMAAADYYALSGGKAFTPVYGTGTIAAHKCWLEFAKNNGNARSITIVFEETTAIDNSQLTVDNEAGAIYDLSGRKLNAAPKRKGVYVKDGQKVVVK